tara:strand:+ start:188 stop:406 length:219 start_codon:yes stop_codon:yes gene_type:complete
MVKRTRKGMARSGAAKGARLAYDNVGASKKRKVGTKIGKKAGVQGSVRRAKAKGASAKKIIQAGRKAHAMFA